MPQHYIFRRILNYKSTIQQDKTPITLRNHSNPKRTEDLPDPRYLALHAAISGILIKSGAIFYVIRLFEEFRNTRTLDPHGGSNLVHLFTSHSISKVSIHCYWTVVFEEQMLISNTLLFTDSSCRFKYHPTGCRRCVPLNLPLFLLCILTHLQLVSSSSHAKIFLLVPLLRSFVLHPRCIVALLFGNIYLGYLHFCCDRLLVSSVNRTSLPVTPIFLYLSVTDTSFRGHLGLVPSVLPCRQIWMRYVPRILISIKLR